MLYPISFTGQQWLWWLIAMITGINAVPLCQDSHLHRVRGTLTGIHTNSTDLLAFLLLLSFLPERHNFSRECKLTSNVMLSCTMAERWLRQLMVHAHCTGAFKWAIDCRHNRGAYCRHTSVKLPRLQACRCLPDSCQVHLPHLDLYCLEYGKCTINYRIKVAPNQSTVWM